MDRAAIETLANQYAPIMKFAEGEHFFPMDAQDYVARCSLHRWEGEDNQRMIHAPGTVDFEKMVAAPEKEHFLVYAEEDYTPSEAEMARVRAQGLDDSVIAVRKLVSRVTDGKRSQAFQRAKVLYEQDPFKPVIYYRVLQKHQHPGNLDIIQYYFFYAFNDWATTHKGINDHEADWERIILYFNNFADGPIAAAYSAHSEHYTRSWDEVRDPQANRPVVFVDGGSHASLPPDQVGEQEGLLKRIWDFIKRGGAQWKPGEIVVGFSETENWHAPTLKALPDVDPAGQKNWVNGFEGLWGARYYWDTPWYIRFFFKLFDAVRGTERPGRAPGGPMHSGTGMVRDDWRDPQAWYDG